MGAAAIQLEDQQFPKRCGHLAGKSLISAAEMAGKVRAACDARENQDTLIVARTDAIAVEGLNAALDRADRYLEAGADILFVEALRDQSDMRQANARFAGRIPLLANMVEGGKTPITSARQLQDLGFAVAIYPGSLVRALSFTAIGLLEALRRDGDTRAWAQQMLDFQALQQLLGTEDLLAKGRKYDSGPADRGPL
jgi:2-methylisocitrate lyase-like PEP mutase family enzyme